MTKDYQTATLAIVVMGFLVAVAIYMIVVIDVGYLKFLAVIPFATAAAGVQTLQDALTPRDRSKDV